MSQRATQQDREAAGQIALANLRAYLKQQSGQLCPDQAALVCSILPGTLGAALLALAWQVRLADQAGSIPAGLAKAVQPLLATIFGED